MNWYNGPWSVCGAGLCLLTAEPPAREAGQAVGSERSLSWLLLLRAARRFPEVILHQRANIATLSYVLSTNC